MTLSGDGVRWVDVPENIDIAFVIDASGDMYKHGFAIKAFAMDFINKIKVIRSDEGFKIAKLRAKLISFTDFMTDGADAIKQTEFFELPKETDKFDAAFCDLTFSGGGDESENGLEALWTAINTDWHFSDPSVSVAQERNMRFIVLISNASKLRLHACDGVRGYDSSVYPNDIRELEDVWSNMHINDDITKVRNYGTMLLIVPFDSDWSSIMGWRKTVTYEFPKVFDDSFTLNAFYEQIKECYAPVFGKWDIL